MLALSSALGALPQVPKCHLTKAFTRAWPLSLAIAGQHTETCNPQCLPHLPGLISHLSISHHLHTLSLLLVPFFLKFVRTVMHVSPQGQRSNWSGPSETMCKTVWVFFSRDSPQLSSDSQRGPWGKGSVTHQPSSLPPFSPKAGKWNSPGAYIYACVL